MARRTTQRERSWGAWSGDLRELQTLARIITESIAELREKSLNAQKKRLKELEEIEPKKPHIDAEIGDVKAFLESADSILPEDNVCATVEDKDETVFGTVKEVLEELDRRSVRSIRFLANPHNELTGNPVSSLGFGFRGENGIFVRIGTSESYENEILKLAVASPDTGWARAAFARLSDEIEKGVPKWAALRKGFGHGYWLAGPIFFPLFVSALIFDFSLAHTKSIQAGVASVLWFAYLATAFMYRKIVDFFFPMLEITAEGKSSSGTQRIVTALLLIASVPLGVLVNLIS